MATEIMTTKQAADYLHLHPESIKRKAREGELPAAKVGRGWRFRKVDLDLWLSNGGTLQSEKPR
jgi:excisionase family DNA binding protein